jgi:hypothetical protein
VSVAAGCESSPLLPNPRSSQEFSSTWINAIPAHETLPKTPFALRQAPPRDSGRAGRPCQADAVGSTLAVCPIHSPKLHSTWSSLTSPSPPPPSTRLPSLSVLPTNSDPVHRGAICQSGLTRGSDSSYPFEFGLAGGSV